MLEVMVMGNLGKDAEVKKINGREYAVFSVCHSVKFKDSKGVEHQDTQWVSCYKTMPCGVIEYLKKGVGVLVRGELSVKSVVDKGKTYINVNCAVSMIRLQYSPKTETPKDETQPDNDELPF